MKLYLYIYIYNKSPNFRNNLQELLIINCFNILSRPIAFIKIRQFSRFRTGSHLSNDLSIRRNVQSNIVTILTGGSMGETEMPTIHFNRDRRRSSFTRPMRDPEEILEGLRSLKAAKRELGRTMSLSGDKRRESREYGCFSLSLSPLFFLA